MVRRALRRGLDCLYIYGKHADPCLYVERLFPDSEYCCVPVPRPVGGPAGRQDLSPGRGRASRQTKTRRNMYKHHLRNVHWNALEHTGRRNVCSPTRPRWEPYLYPLSGRFQNRKTIYIPDIYIYMQVAPGKSLIVTRALPQRLLTKQLIISPM